MIEIAKLPVPASVASVDLAERIARRLACGDADLERLYTARFSDFIDRLRAMPAAIGLRYGLSEAAEARIAADVETTIEQSIRQIEAANNRPANGDAA